MEDTFSTRTHFTWLSKLWWVPEEPGYAFPRLASRNENKCVPSEHFDGASVFVGGPSRSISPSFFYFLVFGIALFSWLSLDRMIFWPLINGTSEIKNHNKMSYRKVLTNPFPKGLKRHLKCKLLLHRAILKLVWAYGFNIWGSADIPNIELLLFLLL